VGKTRISCSRRESNRVSSVRIGGWILLYNWSGRTECAVYRVSRIQGGGKSRALHNRFVLIMTQGRACRGRHTSPRPVLRRSYSHYFWELRRCDFWSATDWLDASVSGENWCFEFIRIFTAFHDFKLLQFSNLFWSFFVKSVSPVQFYM